MSPIIQSPFAASETIRFGRINHNGGFLYTINDSPARVVEYNLLNGLFIKDHKTGVYCCSIESTEGQFQLYRLSEDEFWRVVQGKSFMVITDFSTFRIDDSVLSDKHPLGYSIKSVFRAIENGNHDNNDITYAAPCFQFVEVHPSFSQ